MKADMSRAKVKGEERGAGHEWSAGPSEGSRRGHWPTHSALSPSCRSEHLWPLASLTTVRTSITTATTFTESLREGRGAEAQLTFFIFSSSPSIQMRRYTRKGLADSGISAPKSKRGSYRRNLWKKTRVYLMGESGMCKRVRCTEFVHCAIDKSKTPRDAMFARWRVSFSTIFLISMYTKTQLGSTMNDKCGDTRLHTVDD